jgi:hypothetical protein
VGCQISNVDELFSSGGIESAHQQCGCPNETERIEDCQLDHIPGYRSRCRPICIQVYVPVLRRSIGSVSNDPHTDVQIVGEHPATKGYDV